MNNPFVVFIFIVAILYFIPTIIALIRRKENSLAIFFLNFLLGWTFVGWVIALVWSVAKDRKIQSLIFTNLILRIFV